MSRLLFAAARKARIETLYKGSWIPAVYFEFGFTFSDYRIHPDDAHLQYGPISTALREMAAHNFCDLPPSWQLDLAEFASNAFTTYFNWKEWQPDYPLFYLILAEFLADEGL